VRRTSLKIVRSGIVDAIIKRSSVGDVDEVWSYHLAKIVRPPS
jgi:hypothetical protein